MLFPFVTLQMKQKISASQPDHPDGPQSPATSETDQDTQPHQDTVQSVPLSQTTPQYKGKGNSRQTPQDTTDELLENIRQQQQSNVRLQDQIRAVLEPVSVSTQSLFGSFVGSTLEFSVHPDLQPSFYSETFTLLMKFVEESRQLTAAPTTQPQPPVSTEPPAASFQPIPNPYSLDPAYIQTQHQQFQQYQQPDVQQPQDFRPPPRRFSVESMWNVQGPSAPDATQIRPASTPAPSLNLSAGNLSNLSTLGNSSFLDTLRSNRMDTPLYPWWRPVEHLWQWLEFVLIKCILCAYNVVKLW